MSTTSTAFIVRKLLKTVGSDIQTDETGRLREKPVFPDTRVKSKVFRRQYFAYNLLRKRTSVDPEDPVLLRAGLEKWSESEWRCGVVNNHGRYYSPLGGDKLVFSRLQELTTGFLSSLLVEKWPSFDDLAATGGATNAVPRKFSWAASKLDGTSLLGTPDSQSSSKPSIGCISTAQDLLEELLDANPGYARRLERARRGYGSTFDVSDEELDEGRKTLSSYLCQSPSTALFDYVDKDWASIRLIAKSSAITVMIQKIFGNVLRNALLGVGIDLNDQTVNQEWAEIGSYTGLIATVDLSSASDSIALRHLDYFPPRWREFVMATRDTHVSVGRHSHKLRMVAGMGNGLIFELESALFWAFSMAVTSYLGLDTSFVSVYGDDIIIPSAAKDLLESFLLFNGFLLNAEKSFGGSKEPFRESCGKHFHNGLDVTPVYVKGDLDNEMELNRLINGVCLWGEVTSEPLDDVLHFMLSHIPVKNRSLVPETWDIKSGLYRQFCATIAGPTRTWCRSEQRWMYSVTRWEPTFIDVTERCPESMQVVNSLLTLEGGDDVYDAVKQLRHKHPILHKLLRREPPKEFRRGVISWPGDSTRKRKRDVNHVGDA